MNTKRRLIALGLPLFLVACQTLGPAKMDPGQLGALTATRTQAAAVSPLAMTGGTNSDLPPRADITLTSPGAKGAIISSESQALEQGPAGYGGLVLSVRWPERSGNRSTQLIPKTANSLWIKVYSGSLGATSSLAAPTGNVMASRVVGRNVSDPIPGATPNPCPPNCGGPPQENKSTVYLSLPPGAVTVWIGSFTEEATGVAPTSVYLSSAQGQYTIVANKLSAAQGLSLGANPSIAPGITGITPAFVGAGASVTIAGSNFTGPTLKVSLYTAPGCDTCPPNLKPLIVTNASTTSITATVPTDNVFSGKFKLQIEANGFTVIDGQLGILQNISQFSFDNTTARTFFDGSSNAAYTVQGAKVRFEEITGNVCCTQTQVSLPFSLVTVKAPDTVISSLDASGSFTPNQLGKYDLTAKSGDVIQTMKLQVYKLTSSFGTATNDFNSPEDEMALRLNLVLGCPGFSCATQIPEKLFWGIRNLKFVDVNNAEITNPNPWFANSDFTVTADNGLMLAADRSLTANAPLTSTLTAKLKINPLIVATTSVRVFGPTRVEVDPQAQTTAGTFADLIAKIVYTNPTVAKTVKLGTNTDFNWNVDNLALGSVDLNGRVSRNGSATGTMKATAVRKNDDATFPGSATGSVTFTP